jgi:hypothetical protein
MLDVTYNFGTVALRSCPIFSVLVYTEDGWVPFSEGTPEEQEWVRRQVAGSPLGRTLLSCMRETLWPAGA